MDMSFMTIFDIIILALGAYLVFAGIKNYISRKIDPMLITSDELARCTDVEALSKYLMPKTAVFGAFCILFGIQGVLNDTGKMPSTQTVNVIFLLAFVVVWVVFSYFIRTAKKKYIQ